MAGKPQGRRRGLLVDADPTTIQCVVGALDEICVVRAVASGTEALHFLESDPSIDLILLDSSAREPSWRDFCTTLAETEATRHVLVVLLVTGTDVLPNLSAAPSAVDYLIKPLDQQRVRARVSAYLELIQHRNHLGDLVRRRSKEFAQTCRELAHSFARASEYGDLETALHLQRVSAFCKILGRACGLDAAQYEGLALASTLHDVGKIGVPQEILLKPSELTPAERAVVRDHTTVGAELLAADDNDLLRTARAMALTHHEHWNGSGYPDGLAGEDIPLAGRICAICDVFDALTSPRPYKAPWTVQEAVSFLVAGSGSRFDPTLVDLFVAHLDEVREIMVTHQTETVV